MARRFVAAAFVAVLVLTLFAPASVAAAGDVADEAVLSTGAGGDALAHDRLRPVVAYQGPARDDDRRDDSPLARDVDLGANLSPDADGVLDQPTRAATYRAIRATPGETLAGLADAVGVSKSTVRYHARVLGDAGLVDSTEVAGAHRFAPADADVEVAAALRADGTGAVLEAVAAGEPASVTELAEATDRAPSTVSHHLSRLEDRGLVERERTGEAVVTTLAPVTRAAMATAPALPADD